MRAEPSLPDLRPHGRGICIRVLLVAATLGLGGCLAMPGGTAGMAPAVQMPPAETQVLDDLVATLAQLLAPRSTTLQVAFDSLPLTEALVDRLAAASYGIQRVENDEGAFLLTLERMPVDTPVVQDGEWADLSASDWPDAWPHARPDGQLRGWRASDHGGRAAKASRRVTLLRYRLDAGTVSLSRTYRFSAGTVTPATPLEIGGSELEATLDDSRFGQTAAAGTSRIEYVGTTPLLPDTPLVSLVAEVDAEGVPLVEGVERFASDVDPVVDTSATRESTRSGSAPSRRAVRPELPTPDATDRRRVIASLGYIRRDTASLFGEQGDALPSVRDTFVPVSRQVVLFTSDSASLDDVARQRVQALADGFRPATDIVGLARCNADASAPARVRALIEALHSQGVALERIIDEACEETVGRDSPEARSSIVIELLRWKS